MELSILLNKDCKGSLLIAYQRLVKMYQSKARYQGSWCELFNTKSYKKAQKHEELLLKNFHKFMEKGLEQKVNELGIAYSWERYSLLLWAGSKVVLDVKYGRNQEFLFKVTLNEHSKENN